MKKIQKFGVISRDIWDRVGEFSRIFWGNLKLGQGMSRAFIVIWGITRNSPWRPVLQFAHGGKFKDDSWWVLCLANFMVLFYREYGISVQ